MHVSLEIHMVFKIMLKGCQTVFFVIGDKSYSGLPNVRIAETCYDVNKDMCESLKRQRTIVENAFGLFKRKIKRFAVPQIKGDSARYMKIHIGWGSYII